MGSRDELVADFKQYYNIDLPLCEEGLDAVEDGMRLGILWSQLPASSRVARADLPDLAWGDSERLLWSIEYTLRVIAWQRTEDGAKGRRKPKPLQTPAERSANIRNAEEAIADRAEVDRILGMV